MKKLYLTILLFVAATMGATAQETIEMTKISEKADQGDAESQFLTGYYILIGKTFPFANPIENKDDKKYAIKCFRSAAAQGQADAVFFLGWCYLDGWGVEKNPEEGAKFINEARSKADKLRPLSQYWLGRICESSKDNSAAVELYKAAAKGGYAKAMFELGKRYLTGQGVDQNYSEAAKLFKYASDKGIVEAKSYLAKCYIEGTGVEKDMNEGKKLLEEAASAGDPKAEAVMGEAYLIGMFEEQGEGPNLDIAISYFKGAAEKGQADAQFRLGQFYYKGERVNLDIPKAKELYIQAAKQGHKEAQAELKKRFNMDVSAQ